MAAQAAAQLLDELMGRDRNLAPTEKKREIRWDDQQVCKHFLVKFCPNELFVNTRADLGPCDKIHDDSLKAEYEKSSSYQKMGYEEDFLRFCQSMMADVERRIRRGRQRLSQGGQEGGVASPAQVRGNEEKIQMLSERLNGLLEQVERLGCEGKVEEAQGIMKLCDQLKDEREGLRRTNENSHWMQTAEIAAAQEKQMEVCEVCGAFLIVGDAQQRVDDHLMGKQHMGFAKIKSTVDEILPEQAISEEVLELKLQNYELETKIQELNSSWYVKALTDEDVSLPSSPARRSNQSIPVSAIAKVMSDPSEKLQLSLEENTRQREREEREEKREKEREERRKQREEEERAREKEREDRRKKLEEEKRKERERERRKRKRSRSRDRDRKRSRSRSRTRKHSRSRSRDRRRSSSHTRQSRSKDRSHRSRSKDRKRSQSRSRSEVQRKSRHSHSRSPTRDRKDRHRESGKNKYKDTDDRYGPLTEEQFNDNGKDLYKDKDERKDWDSPRDTPTRSVTEDASPSNSKSADGTKWQVSGWTEIRQRHDADSNGAKSEGDSEQ